MSAWRPSSKHLIKKSLRGKGKKKGSGGGRILSNVIELARKNKMGGGYNS